MISGNFERVFETEKPENCGDELLKSNNIERFKKKKCVINLRNCKNHLRSNDL